MEEKNPLIFETWRAMLARIGDLTEQQLVEAINLEVSIYRRKIVINRLHQRYSKMRAARERALLLKGELLL